MHVDLSPNRRSMSTARSLAAWSCVTCNASVCGKFSRPTDILDPALIFGRHAAVFKGATTWPVGIWNPCKLWIQEDSLFAVRMILHPFCIPSDSSAEDQSKCPLAVSSEKRLARINYYNLSGSSFGPKINYQGNTSLVTTKLIKTELCNGRCWLLWWLHEQMQCQPMMWHLDLHGADDLCVAFSRCLRCWLRISYRRVKYEWSLNLSWGVI
jgi:hypothetical protein